MVLLMAGTIQSATKWDDYNTLNSFWKISWKYNGAGILSLNSRNQEYMGVFLNGGTPKTPENDKFSRKPIVVGYQQFRKPPYMNLVSHPIIQNCPRMESIKLLKVYSTSFTASFIYMFGFGMFNYYILATCKTLISSI